MWCSTVLHKSMLVNLLLFLGLGQELFQHLDVFFMVYSSREEEEADHTSRTDYMV